MARCPTCEQSVKPRVEINPDMVDDGAAGLWASYILYLLSKYPSEFKARVVGKVARAIGDAEGD